jgi:hypothetical protein
MDRDYATDFGFRFELLPLLSCSPTENQTPVLFIPPLQVVSEKFPSFVKNYRQEFVNSLKPNLKLSSTTKKKNKITSFLEWRKENKVDNFKFSAFRKRISVLKFQGKRTRRNQNKIVFKYPGKSKAASERPRKHGKFVQNKT